MSKPSKQEIIPLQDRVLIEPFETDHTSAGGIVLAGDDMKYNRAKVLAVGAGRAMPREIPSSMVTYRIQLKIS